MDGNAIVYGMVFIGFLVSVKHNKDPILLLLDGHAPHISPEVIRLAKANNVHMMCLPSNSSHLTQPVDVGLLKPAKTVFRQVVEEEKLKLLHVEKLNV